MARLRKFATALMLSLHFINGPAAADCVLIDRLDNLQIIQARLGRDPNTALFATDIRQLRGLSAGISDRDVLDAVSGNRFTGIGANFLGFLDDTQALLLRVSLDDPQSVRPHFTALRRSNLAEIRTHLNSLRCNKGDLESARITAAADIGTGGEENDAEDLAEVAETLSVIADEIFRWRSLAIMVGFASAVSIIVPILRNWLLMRRRKAKRHNTRHTTNYQWDSRKIEGMLVDINCFGAKLRHERDNPIPLGTALEIRIDDSDVSGTVMWSNAHYSGVQFRKSITLEAVAFVRASVDRTHKQNGAPRDAV